MTVDELVVYTQDGCPYCKELLERYQREGVTYQEVCLNSLPELRDKLKQQYGVDRVPVVVRDGQLVTGESKGG